MSKGTQNLLCGTWDCTEFASEVRFIITCKDGGMGVEVIDIADRERADVFEIFFKDDVLSFAAYWNSSGRFVRYKVRFTEGDELGVTYTYTAQTTFLRKKTSSG